MAEYKKTYDAKKRWAEDQRMHPMLWVEKWAPALAKWNANRLAKEQVISVNQYLKGKEEVKCTFLAHPLETKSDGFILQYIAKDGAEIFTVDGGMTLGDMQRALLKLRREILCAAGLEKAVENRKYKLDINLLISHFHIDHVNELITNVIPLRKFIRVQNIYYAADTVITGDQAFDQMKNGDFTNRPRLMRALRCYQPGVKHHEIPYGETLQVKTKVGALKLFAPAFDWGKMEYANRLAETYYPSTENPVFNRTPVGIGNNNSTWMKASFAGKSVLLTGDVMKSHPARDDEAVDCMIEYYGGELRSNIVKCPHHGVSRPGVVGPIRDHLLIPGDDACVVLTGIKGCQEVGVLLDEAGLPWADINQGDLTYSLTREGIKQTIAK